METLNSLLNAKADPNLGKDLPIYKAITSSNFELAKILLKHGANLNVVNNKKDTPLIYWIRQNHIQVPSLLLLRLNNSHLLERQNAD